MKRITNKKKFNHLIVLCILLTVGIALVNVLILLYSNIIVERLKNRGEMSTELGYQVISDTNDDFIIEDKTEKISLYDYEYNLVADYKINDISKFNYEWIETELISGKYIISHYKNGQNFHRDHLNCMVGDRLYKLNSESLVAEVIYEIQGSNRILYACDKYLIIYNSESNSCQWIDYKKDEILSSKPINLNLKNLHEYKCIYNERDNKLTFEEYSDNLLGVKVTEIAVIECAENTGKRADSLNP